MSRPLPRLCDEKYLESAIAIRTAAGGNGNGISSDFIVNVKEKVSLIGLSEREASLGERSLPVEMEMERTLFLFRLQIVQTLEN